MVQTQSWPGPKNRHFINMSLLKICLSAVAGLEVYIGQVDSVSNIFIILAISKKR